MAIRFKAQIYLTQSEQVNLTKQWFDFSSSIKLSLVLVSFYKHLLHNFVAFSWFNAKYKLELKTSVEYKGIVFK